MARLDKQGNRPETKCAARNAAKDPAVWGWAVVALLALLPLRMALADHRVDAGAGGPPPATSTSAAPAPRS